MFEKNRQGFMTSFDGFRPADPEWYETIPIEVHYAVGALILIFIIYFFVFRKKKRNEAEDEDDL